MVLHHEPHLRVNENYLDLRNLGSTRPASDSGHAISVLKMVYYTSSNKSYFAIFSYQGAQSMRDQWLLYKMRKG